MNKLKLIFIADDIWEDRRTDLLVTFTRWKYCVFFTMWFHPINLCFHVVCANEPLRRLMYRLVGTHTVSSNIYFSRISAKFVIDLWILSDDIYRFSLHIRINDSDEWSRIKKKTIFPLQKSINVSQPVFDHTEPSIQPFSFNSIQQILNQCIYSTRNAAQYIARSSSDHIGTFHVLYITNDMEKMRFGTSNIKSSSRMSGLFNTLTRFLLATTEETYFQRSNSHFDVDIICFILVSFELFIFCPFSGDVLSSLVMPNAKVNTKMFI